MNTIDFFPVPHQPITIQDEKQLSVLHVYTGSINNFGWTYAAHQGVIQAAVSYSAGLTYTEIFNADFSTDSISAYIDAAINPYDVVFLWKFDMSAEDVDPIASLYPTTQFVICSPGGVQNTAPEDALDRRNINPTIIRNNTNYIYGHIFHARYLAGILVGLMIADGKQFSSMSHFNV